SMSANTGVAPTRAIASAVAKNVKAGQITSSPDPMPSASSTSTMASVPFATPIDCRVPRYAAASCSNPSTSGPKMNRPVSSVRSKASFSSGTRGSYCALTSTWGIRTSGHANRPAAADHQEGHDEHDRDAYRDVDPHEVMVDGAPARPDRPA